MMDFPDRVTLTYYGSTLTEVDVTKCQDGAVDYIREDVARAELEQERKDYREAWAMYQKTKAELERARENANSIALAGARLTIKELKAELERAQERASSFEGSFNASIVRISELEDHIRARQLAFEAELEQAIPKAEVRDAFVTFIRKHCQHPTLGFHQRKTVLELLRQLLPEQNCKEDSE